MTEDNEGYSGKGLKGPAYWIASILTAGVAERFLRNGGLAGAFGPPPGGPGAPVSREVLDLTTENQGLKSRLYANELNTAQSVWNATQQGRIDCLQRQVDALYGMTKLSIPNASLNPGYGPAVVGPAPVPVIGPASTPDATLASSIATAVATAVADAMKAAA
jgi:hypothetical protein